MSARKKKKRKQIKYTDVQLNVMPFIDVFSLLNTFLLMSAAFLTFGIVEVQIPFLSTQAPEDQKDENERYLEVKVDMEKELVKVITSYSRPPVNEETKEFEVTEAGIAELHKHMVEVKRTDPEADKIQFFTEDDVIWEDMAAILDAVKLRADGDPLFVDPEMDEKKRLEAERYLFPKIVMASVMLR